MPQRRREPWRRLCAEHGIAHRILVWSGPKPSTGLPAAAREARYRLLAEAAQAEGIGLILTGHTADDQAETVLMRQRGRGRAGRPGLAGMAPATLYDWRTWIVRPLLGMRRAALREFLRRRDMSAGPMIRPISTSTSNGRAFARRWPGTQVRSALPRRLRLAGQAAGEREQLGRQRRGADPCTLPARPAMGLVRLDPGLATAGDSQAAVYALRILLATIGGVAFLPDQARSEALFDRLRAGPLCATLSRTVVDARRAGIFLRRESRDLPPPPLAATTRCGTAADASHWATAPAALLIAPLGAAAAAKLAIADGRHAAKPCCAPPWPRNRHYGAAANASGLPQESRGRQAIAARPVVAPFARFLPSFDLAPASAVAELIGAIAVPALPFSSHSAG